MRNTCVLGVLLLVIACKTTRQNEVWDLYDIRHPVPAGSAIPASRADIIYRDNDAAYTQPKTSFCLINPLASACE